jgi:cell division protein FtsL
MGKTQLIRALQIAAAILVVVLVVGLYKAKTDASRAQAHVHQLQQDIATAASDNRALRAEIAHLESPAHVERLAEQHGLDTAADAQSAALPQSAIATRLPPPRDPPGTRR